MVGPRDYSEATRKALFGLSLGRCYARGCAQQVMQMNGEIPVITVQIAHIRAAKRDGPRYDPAMSDDERRAFKNLILLCTFHHGSVDGKETGSDYSVKDLEAWKTEREGGLFADLSALTENDLKELLGVSVRTILSEVKEELLEQIASVEVVTGENARLLRILVAETFQRPQLDADLAASLADSSRALGHLSEIAPMLESTSYRLQELPDYAVMLSDTSRDLQILPDYVGMLDRTSHALMVLPDYAPILAEAASKVASLPNEAEKLNTAAYEIRQAADSVSSLMRDTSAITELKEASAELASHSDELKNSAYLLASGRVPQQPDRMTWFLRGAATAAVVLVVVGILITVLVTRSSGS